MASLKYLLYTSLLFICCIGFIACGEEEDPDDPDTPPVTTEENTIQFMINGGLFETQKFVSFTNFYEANCRYGADETGSFSELFSTGTYDNENAFLHIQFNEIGTDTVSYYSDTPEYLSSIYAGQFFQIVLGSTAYNLDYCNLYIDEYGEVGDRIKGRFDGRMLDFTNFPSGEFVYINQGVFDVERTQ